MVPVHAGTFRMGCLSNGSHCNDEEKPAHEVHIGNPFAVSVYEVTFEEWDACVAGGDCEGRVFRGGSWIDSLPDGYTLRSAHRGRIAHQPSVGTSEASAIRRSLVSRVAPITRAVATKILSAGSR